MYHYNAFISYNHNPRDIKIARLLQHKLENYKLPKGLHTSSGADKIERVFLDTGELEVSGDLNKVIVDALENSDYLIVICSPEGKASIWVKREMEYFLRNHTADNILTVITAGEPFDVLPELLLYEDVIDEETGEVTRNYLEPLSCDYRRPEKEANRTELPRLVAALVGCRYDDLVQRRKQYVQKIKTRVAAGIAAFMMLASGYMVWNNHRLSVSYDRTLVEQSNSLVLQSRQALAKGDRIDAVRYALEALPTEEQPRPLVTDAVLALSGSLNMYYTPQTIYKETAARQYKGTVNGRVIDDSDVRIIGTLSRAGRNYFYAVYGNAGLCIWDRGSGEQILTEYTDKISGVSSVLGAVTDEEGLMYIISDASVSCLDVSSGTELWHNELTGYAYNGGPVHVSGKTLWTVLDDFSAEFYNCVRAYDTASGSTVCEYLTDDYPKALCASPDGKTAVCAFGVNDPEDAFKTDHFRLTAVGPGRDEITEIAEFPYINNIQFDNEGRLIAVSQSENPGTAPSETAVFKYISGATVTVSSSYDNKTYTLTCIDPSGWNEVWTREITGYFNSVPKISTADSPESEDGLTACTIGRTLMYFDENGEMTRSLDFGSVIETYYRKDGNLKEDRLYAVLADGSRGSFSAEEEDIYNQYDIFLGPVSDALYDDGSLFIVSSDTASNIESIIEYHMTGYDEHWQEFPTPAVADGWYVCNDLYAESVADGFAVIREYRPDEGSKAAAEGKTQRFGISFHGSESDGTSADEILLDAPQNNYYEYAGCANEKLYFCAEEGSSIYTLCVDPASGKTEEKEYTGISRQGYDRGHWVTGSSGTAKMHFLSTPSPFDFDDSEDAEPSANSLIMVNLDLEESSSETLPLAKLTSEECSYLDNVDRSNPFLDDEEQALWIAVSDSTVKKLDISSGKEILSVETDYTPVSLSADGSGHLYILEQVNTSCILHIYDSKTGKQLHETEIENLEIYTGISDPDAALLSDGNILLTTRYDSFVLDAADFSILSRFYDYRAYNPDTDEICIEEGYNGTQFVAGYVPYRTIPEIILEGAAFTGQN